MISIVVPAYNNTDEVDKLLRSLKDDGTERYFSEIIVVDDGSEGESIKEVAARYPRTRYLRMEQNCGVAAARNRGAREAENDDLLFLDSDAVVFPDTIEKVARHFSDKRIKAFIGRFDFVPENDGFFPRFKAIMFNSWMPEGEYSTVVSPAFCAMRKDVFFGSGGFDENIKGATVGWVKLSYELSKRCKIYYFPDIVIRIKLNSFYKALFTDFYATMKWVTIFSRYKMFDNHCTSVSTAAGRCLGSVTFMSLPAALLFNYMPLWSALFAVYLFVNRKFFLLVLKRESFLFFLGSVATHMALSTVTVLGGLAGLALVIKERVFGTGCAVSTKRGNGNLL